MKKHPVVFMVKKEYDNLGIGYMSAVLDKAGFSTKIIDINKRKGNILKKLKKLKPLLVGFSVIYQYNIDLFADTVKYLRKGGISCHFTAGGHYASLRYDELFELIPLLDSVLRFEGEYSIRELAECISQDAEWKNIKSLAYAENGKIIANPLRSLEQNLDRLPYPKRSHLRNYAFNKKFATLLAGRGCVYNCSFCNLRDFYLPFPGQTKRIRKPEMVVSEMQSLFDEKDCTVFLFQDDDFPLKSYDSWISVFCEKLKSSGLGDKIMWKINCRPDEIEEESFSVMKKNGLFLVFIGIEDGTNNGLERINKHMTVANSIEAIRTLKKLEIGFDFGFMLFQPATTFASINENLDFLRRICGDGYSPVSFLKMMPYYNTQIEKELIAEGRLKGKPGYRDYDFLEDAMNLYFSYITDCFMEWMRYADGVANISKWARNYLAVCSRFFKFTPAVTSISKDVKKIISESNLYLLDNMKELAFGFESGKFTDLKHKELRQSRKEIRRKQFQYCERINISMTQLLGVIDDKHRLVPASH